jgi:hypothetical protein
MKSRFIFDESDGISEKEITSFSGLLRKGEIVEFQKRFYEIEHCSYAPECSEATYWLFPGDDQHPTAPDF